MMDFGSRVFQTLIFPKMEEASLEHTLGKLLYILIFTQFCEEKSFWFYKLLTVNDKRLRLFIAFS